MEFACSNLLQFFASKVRQCRVFFCLQLLSPLILIKYLTVLRVIIPVLAQLVPAIFAKSIDVAFFI